MSLTDPNFDISDDDFERIEDAVMETARGRWFLREFARRQRASETRTLLDAIHRIERVVSGSSPALATSLAAEHHTDGLRERCERLSEIAWTLRERGYDGAICAMIEAEARRIGALVAELRGEGPLLVAGSEDDAAPAPAPQGELRRTA